MVRVQFIRYVLVGLGLNAALYTAYLLLTWGSMGSEAAMTITVSVGTLVSFVANRTLTFRHRGDRGAALRRFLACYVIIYFIDFIALWVFAGQMAVPHQIVQGGAVIVLPLLGFIMQRYWIFRPADGTPERIPMRATP
ncbi:GtrA family protein [Mycobacterium terramassiliense]|nr:GtrA family protein [Mycobacterium terramassiliense]